MLETDNYEKFKKDILQLAGIDLNSYKEKQMRRRINTLITKNNVKTYNDYVALIKKDKEKFDQFINFLTINVSEFYRNPDQWKILEGQVFPELIKKFGKNLKIWSAACSTGDEPYSLVMALSRQVPLANIKKDKEKFDQFINFLTINVSEFYRNPDQWKILEGQVFPELIKKFGKNLKIWSAACSTGDEPYSLVMALSRQVPLANIKIIATDIDNQVLDTARMGLYNEKSIASVPDDLKKKYFTKVGSSYQISDEIKKRVEFKKHDLLKDPYPSGCNLIVCRNVVIYFTEEAKDVIYQKFHKALQPGGVLFIGSTEQIMNYRELGFDRHTSFFFEKK